MKPILSALIIIAGVSAGHAGDLVKIGDSYMILSEGVSLASETISNRVIARPPKEWIVAKGSETYTLDKFVSSGKFCDIYGHSWTLNGGANCNYCKRWRKKIKVKEEVEQWEP